MKRWFQRRSRREQGLLLLFAGLAGLVWLGSASGRLRRSLGEWRATRVNLAAQQLWLDQAPAIEKRSAASVRDLDPARTYDVTRLVAEISAIAGTAGVQVAVDPPVTERTPQFAYHTAKASLRRATLPQVLRFYDELARRSPYLSLEAVTLQTERASGTLNATIQVSATQITPAAK